MYLGLIMPQILDFTLMTVFKLVLHIYNYINIGVVELSLFNQMCMGDM